MPPALSWRGRRDIAAFVLSRAVAESSSSYRSVGSRVTHATEQNQVAEFVASAKLGWDSVMDAEPVVAAAASAGLVSFTNLLA
jgi:hypothetical protein